MAILAYFLLLILFILIIYIFFMSYSQLKGGPFIPTDKKLLLEIFAQANFKKGQLILELGSGDGRVLIEAAKLYPVKGIGCEVNPFLVLYSNIIAKFYKLTQLSFKRGDLFKFDLSKADVVFIFLLPQTVKKLVPKITKECKQNTLIISHGFKIPGFEKKLISKINKNPFPTYFYKI